MKTVLLAILITIAGFMKTMAQEIDSLDISIEARLDNLTTKVNELQHDYEFLNCINRLEHDNYTLKDFHHEISIETYEILYDCHHSKFNTDLFLKRKKSYDNKITYLDKLKENIEATKVFIAIKLVTIDFTDQEQKRLKLSCLLLDTFPPLLENQIERYKIALDYWENIRYIKQ